MEKFINEQQWEINEIYSDCAVSYMRRMKGISVRENDTRILRVSLHLKNVLGLVDSASKLINSIQPDELKNEFMLVFQYKNEYGVFYDQISNKKCSVIKRRAYSIHTCSLDSGMTFSGTSSKERENLIIERIMSFSSKKSIAHDNFLRSKSMLSIVFSILLLVEIQPEIMKKISKFIFFIINREYVVKTDFLQTMLDNLLILSKSNKILFLQRLIIKKIFTFPYLLTIYPEFGSCIWDVSVADENGFKGLFEMTRQREKELILKVDSLKDKLTSLNEQLQRKDKIIKESTSDILLTKQELQLSNQKLKNEQRDILKQNCSLKHEVEKLKKQIDNFDAEKKEQLSQDRCFIKVNIEEMKTKYPLLYLMVQRFVNNGKGSDELKKYSAILQMLSSSCCNFISSKSNIYSERTIEAYNKEEKEKLSSLLTTDLSDSSKDHTEVLREILTNAYGEKFIDSLKENPMNVTLGGDAAHILENDKSAANVYVFQIIPLDFNIEPTVANLTFVPSGSSPDKIPRIYTNIAKALANLNIFAKFKATDGDTKFDSIHSIFYDEVVATRRNSGDTFDQILEDIKDLTGIPVSDFLHLLKCARSHLLNHLILLIPELLITINVELFKNATGLKDEFDDLSTHGRMKDSYPLNIFSWTTYIKLMHEQRYDAAFYILPFVYMSEAIRGVNTSVKEKLNFLKGAYDLFTFHLDNVEKYGSNKYFPSKYRSPAVGTLFGDKVYIKRCINTCIALGIALKMKTPRLGMERVSTHLLECYFGYMRLVSYFVHSKANAIKSAVRSIILRKYFRELGISRNISKRDNIGGIHINMIEGYPVNSTRDKGHYTVMPFIPSQHGFQIMDLLTGKESPDSEYSKETIDPTIEFINANFTRKQIANPSRVAGAGPQQRNLLYSRMLSSIPIVNTSNPNAITPFTYFERHKKIIKSSTNNDFISWSIAIMNSIINPIKQQNTITPPEQRLHNPAPKIDTNVTKINEAINIIKNAAQGSGIQDKKDDYAVANEIKDVDSVANYLTKAFRPDELEIVQNKIFEHNCSELSSLLNKKPISPKDISTKGMFYSRDYLSLLLKQNLNLLSTLKDTNYGEENEDKPLSSLFEGDGDNIIEKLSEYSFS